MEFKQLEAYVKVIELSSFSKAAETLFFSQPSVSSYIHSLEKELGTTLINRTTKEMSPTHAGMILYENAKEILALKHGTVEKIKNLSGDLCGEINVLASSVLSQYVLPEVIAKFQQVYPDISFHIKQADTLKVARGIASQQAEIGFSGGIAENDKCHFTEFITEQMVFIAPCNEQFSRSQTYFLEELLYQHQFIGRENGSGTKTQYEKFFTSQNIDIKKMNTGVSFDNTQSIINGVISGLGVSVVSELAARPFIERKMVLPIQLKTKLPERKLYYVLKKNFTNSHLVDVFIDFLMGKDRKELI